MKTKTFFITLGAVVSLSGLATNSIAAENNSAAKPNDVHGIKIASHAGAKVDKLATLLTQHAKSAMDKTQHAMSHLVKRAEQAGHKAQTAAKKTIHKVGEKIEKISE